MTIWEKTTETLLFDDVSLVERFKLPLFEKPPEQVPIARELTYEEQMQEDPTQFG